MLIKVRETQKEAILKASENNEKVFIEPSHFLNSFIIQKMFRYIVMPIPKHLYILSEEKKNVNINDFLNIFGDNIKNTPFNILTRNLYKQVNHNIKLLLSFEENIVNTTKEGLVLFFSFFQANPDYINEEIKLFSFEEDIEKLIENSVKEFVENNFNKKFYPLSLERLIKLYGVLYLSKESKDKEKVQFISYLQEHLLNINILADFNKILLEEAISFFKKESEYFEIMGFPIGNLINKIVEEFLFLEFLQKLETDNHVIKKDKSENNYNLDSYSIKEDCLKEIKENLKKNIFYKKNNNLEFNSFNSLFFL